jgi:hypothetical protein
MPGDMSMLKLGAKASMNPVKGQDGSGRRHG